MKDLRKEIEQLKNKERTSDEGNKLMCLEQELNEKVKACDCEKCICGGCKTCGTCTCA